QRNWWLTIVSAALAGWMMGLLAWLVSACRDTISQIVIVWMVTTAIGLASLPHAVAGAGEVLVSVLAGTGVSWADFLQFQFWTTIGNSIGGVVFVAALKYGHSTRDVGSDENNSRAIASHRRPTARH